jgi:hypothetical protein
MRRGQRAASDAEFFADMKRVLTLYRFSAGKMTHLDDPMDDWTEVLG